MKIVINAGYGGFSVSRKAANFMAERGSEGASERSDYERTDPLLIEAVETLGKDANGDYATLKVIEIPDGVDYEIDEYDGYESIHEKHRSWG